MQELVAAKTNIGFFKSGALHKDSCYALRIVFISEC